MPVAFGDVRSWGVKRTLVGDSYQVSSTIGRISALLERQPDILDHKVMDPASLIESNLLQRFISFVATWR
jgi:hypothetical protein